MKLEDVSFVIVRYLLPSMLFIVGVLTAFGLGEFRPDYEFTEENFRKIYSALCFSSSVMIYYLLKDLIKKKDKSGMKAIPQKEE